MLVVGCVGRRRFHDGVELGGEVCDLRFGRDPLGQQRLGQRGSLVIGGGYGATEPVSGTQGAGCLSRKA